MSDQALLGFGELVECLDEAVQLTSLDAITGRVKAELIKLIRARRLQLPDTYRQTRPEGYARRLLYRSEPFGYTAVVMTWAAGQRTPLHDHSGIWCVEGVVEGTMEVTRFDLVDESGGTFRFAEKGCVKASVGSAGCLIPPFEYHVLANALANEPSITLHVYGGEMDRCHIFEPRADGTYQRVERRLSYHD